MRLDALRALTACCTSVHHLDRVDELATRLEHEAAVSGSVEHLTHALLAQRFVCKTRGEVCATRRLEVRLRDLASRERCPTAAAILRQIDVGRAIVTGNLSDACDGVAGMLAAAGDSGDELVGQSAVAAALLADWMTGASSELLDLATGLADHQSAMQAWHAAVLTMRAATMSVDELSQELCRSLGPDLPALPHHALWLAQLVMYADLARRCGDAARGRALADELLPFADHVALLGDALELGSAWLGVGAGLEAAGELNDAADAYGRAAEANREHGSTVWELVASLRLLRLRMRIESPPAAGEVRALLARIDELGAPPLLDEASDLRSHVESPLSRREIEVARVVAAGATNVDAAARLFISVKTVERHLANIFNKLGLSSRVELATWAISTGVADADARWVA